MRIHEAVSHYLIYRDDGVYAQRKAPGLATSSPLDDHERVIIDMCKHILSARTEAGRTGWVKHDDVPNIKAYSVFHRELNLPLVTRLPDGSWWVHPPIGSPGEKPQNGEGQK